MNSNKYYVDQYGVKLIIDKIAHMKRSMMSYINLKLLGGDGKLHITTTLADGQPVTKANLFRTEEEFIANKPYKQIDIPGTYVQDDPVIYCLSFPNTSSASIGTISVQGAPQWIQMNDTGNRNCAINCTSMDLSILDTMGMTKLKHSFFGCKKLSSIDLNHLDTSKVTDMSECFGACMGATSIAVDKWDTSKVTTMASMFRADSSLKSIDLSNWDTSKVTDMSMMFLGCSSLTDIKADNWDLGSLTNIETTSGAVKGKMFDNCTSLVNMNIDNWNPKSLTSYKGWFWNLMTWVGNNGSVNCSSWDTSKVTDITSMFRGTSITTINLSGWNLQNCTTAVQMFMACTKLTTVNLSNWKIRDKFNVGGMFRGCYNMTDLNLTGWDLSKIDNNDTMFQNCTKLTHIIMAFDGTDNVITNQYETDGNTKHNLTVTDPASGITYRWDILLKKWAEKI